ncbi:integrase core domain-containing protein [Lentzea sp. NPDC004782]|uniref:integrase core domain-containing protein n=1 Tax=Lentzea sp. NPDC004782 TaxID=3154458 RepID=UPI0033AC673E
MLRPPIESAQYTSDQYARSAADAGVRLSVGSKGQCWDNAVAESFFATIKTELLDRQPSPTKAKAHKAIFEYIESWRNTRCKHSSLGHLSSAAYESTRYLPPASNPVHTFFFDAGAVAKICGSRSSGGFLAGGVRRACSR